MKKVFALSFCMSLLFFSCKQNDVQPDKQTTTADTEKPQDDPTLDEYCEELMAMVDGADKEKQLEWIENHKEDLCNGKFYACVLKNHDIETIDNFDNMVKSYWNTKTPIYFSLTWQEIKGYIGNKCYPEYLSFDVNPTSNVISNPKMITSHRDFPSCFSPVLLRAIDSKYNGLNNTDTFEFTLAKDKNDNNCIVFKVKGSGTTYSYYDLTLDPTSEDIVKLYLSTLTKPTITVDK